MASGNCFVLLVLITAFVFDFINGFHDAANSIATIVTTKVLTPRQAVLWAAFFNFIAFLVFNLMVAQTIGNGLIDTSIVDAKLIFAALIGAITWNLATWYFGLPSSSSHALIGGLAGGAIVKAGTGVLIPTGFIKVFIGILLSPLVGLIIAFMVAYLLARLKRTLPPKYARTMFKGLQLFSSALLSLTHGGNDAQKTMGVIAVLLFSASWLKGPFYIPLWVVISCHLVISLGTLVGGWRIVHVMGTKITHLNPLKGCAAETGAAAIIFVATECGVPVSTTHTVTGAISGVGLLQGLWNVNVTILRRIFCSWVLTLPMSGLVAAGVAWAMK